MPLRPIVQSSQLRPPALRPDVLPRARLLSLLRSASSYRLVLLSADAGYGKTTLLSQFHTACSGTAIWYTLTEREADLAILFRLLTEGVAQHFRTARKSLERYLIEHPALHRDPTGAAMALVEALARAARRDYYLLLDDAHLLSGSPFVPQFLTTLVEQLPPHFHVVMAARHEPPLPVPLWRARRQVLELRNVDLKFLRQEAEELYRDRLKLSLRPSDIELLHRHTEGWAAGLRWIAERMRLGDSTDSIGETVEELRRGTGGLSEFYEAELFRRLPDREQAFLLRVSSLDSMDPDLAALAWKPSDRPQIIRSLVRRNLLVATSQRSSEQLRLHPLFREFLLERAREELPPAERARLLEALGRRLVTTDPVAGLEQWRLIPAPELVADWLAQHGELLLAEGRHGGLDGLLRGLPRASVEGNPRLRLLRAENRRILGEFPGALEDFRAVERAAGAAKDTSVAADAALGAAKIYTARGDAARSLRIGQGLLRLGEKLQPRVRARALQIVGGALFYLGRHEETEKALSAFMAHLEDHPEPELELAAEHNRALNFCAMGRFLEGRELFERHLKREEVRNSRRRPLHMANLALLQLECGEADRARETVLEAETLLERGGNLLQRASVLLTRGEVELRLGNLDGVTGMTEELVRQSGDLAHKAIEVGVLLLRARHERLEGRPERARQLVSEGLRALKNERGSVWFDLRLLEADLLLDEHRWVRSSTLFRTLLRQATAIGLLQVEARARLGLASALWHLERRAEARRVLSQGLALCAAQQYEQIALESGERCADLYADAWAGNHSAEWLSRLFGRKPELFWEALVQHYAAGAKPFPAAAALLADWADLRGLRLLQAWEGFGGALRTEAARARRALERRLGMGVAQATAPRVEVQVLGPLEVRVRGERIPLRAFRTERAALIFAHLALRGSAGETRDRLMNLFWPRASVTEARRNLSPTLSYLRGAFRESLGEGEVLETERGRVRLAAGLAASTTLELARRFERLPEGDAARGQAALDYLGARRGEFLEGSEGDWIEEARKEETRLYRLALHVAAAAARAEGRPEESERWLNEALRSDPLDEAAHRALLELLASGGDFGRVWSEYRAFSNLLRKETGTSPDPATMKLVSRLRAVQRESAN